MIPPPGINTSVISYTDAATRNRFSRNKLALHPVNAANAAANAARLRQEIDSRVNVDLTAETPSPAVVLGGLSAPNSSLSFDLTSFPKTPDFEIRVRKRIVNKLRTSKRRNLSQDDVASLLEVQDKLTSKDPSFSRKLADYVEATEEDEEENSEEYVGYLRMIADHEKK